MLAPMGEKKEPLLRRVLDIWLGAGFDDVIVVLGCGASDIRARFEEDLLRRVIGPGSAATSFRFVENSGWESGMFSSVQCGLAATAAGSTHVAISPADLPFLSKSSLRSVLSAAASLDAAGLSLAVPTHSGRRGHPLLIPAALRARLLSWPDSARLNQLFEEPDVTVHSLDGFDDSILRDVDTPADLAEERDRPAVPR